MADDQKRKDTSQLVEGLPNWAWQTYFAPQKGLIPQMNQKLSDICEKLDDVEDQVGKHNHFDNRLHNVEGRITSQERKCEAELAKKNTIEATEAAIQVRLKEERQNQFEQDWYNFDRTYKRSQMITGIVSLIVGAVIALVVAYYF